MGTSSIEPITHIIAFLGSLAAMVVLIQFGNIYWAILPAVLSVFLCFIGGWHGEKIK